MEYGSANFVWIEATYDGEQNLSCKNSGCSDAT